ncbi:hypothetical protein COY07_00175 [Candidatus Peregrinibacteria bacterium CG_4_10_14_0_2_um_filter_43_11]|nr:MAG: hypothetical protein COY07_00175 [Candidatus Peregrinibacteria bacterium CG_4_10_14_0_2_um_filter_43_11]
MKSISRHGEAAFREYYRRWFPKEAAFETWLDVMKNPASPILRFHPEKEKELKTLWGKAGLLWQPLLWHKNAVLWPPEAEPGTPLPGFESHLFYPMNASSLLPVLALRVQPDDVVLDACAAPGGKALFLSEFIGTKGHLVANDNSPNRRQRMRQMFEQYGATSIEVWGRKAETIFKTNPGDFDKILVDAPCSSEKHVLNSAKHLGEWSYGRIRQLKQRQIALLSGLFLALKPGGRMVYSTCAFTPEENEEVVAKLLKKKQDAIRLCEPKNNLPGGAGIKGDYITSFPPSAVRRVWPDNNHDPMFVAVFEKMKEK